eukprot:CAMPEP_0202820988 /NCGR_PEP_ID=MMETSP1389-20130828/10107_1 /ASSEMBLY_ACC=CAM_ASM_000865 /TAXON_ID=302021 /ORGANISM="Rhodomonas sp., Strain CCMP768" /LENGTH=238 /DNA_ID=CAMNT_0049493721 /DNA_START=206 /DNA_END=924 /DNA_ORIENTATION=-
MIFQLVSFDIRSARPAGSLALQVEQAVWHCSSGCGECEVKLSLGWSGFRQGDHVGWEVEGQVQEGAQVRECVREAPREAVQVFGAQDGEQIQQGDSEAAVHEPLQSAPVSISKLVKEMKNKQGKIATVVGTVTNDIRLTDDTGLKFTLCCLRITDGARARITAAGGEIITFDQLALRAPTGTNCVLLRGPLKAREVYKHFGRAPGVPHSTTKPYTRNSTKSRKFESARGRRRTCGFKV